MKPLFKAISYLGLALTVLSPILVWNGRITVETNKTLLIIGMILWFGTAIFWIKHEKTEG
jgi:hypothetical protein